MLEAVCEDPTDEYRYVNSLGSVTRGNDSVLQDWPNIAGEWILSLSFNDGVSGANSSNSRLLSQLVLTNTTSPDSPAQLSPAYPSAAEALAVLAGCTLLRSATDAPFVSFWNYSQHDDFITGQYQYFNASIRAQLYASGSTQPYQNAFYLILFGVFIINTIVLIYFCVHREWYNDFCEPTNLFSLAVNSPPCKDLAGSRGGGPAGEQYNVSWKLNTAGEHVYMDSQEKPVEDLNERDSSVGLRRKTFNQGVDMLMTPIRKAHNTFDLKRSGV